MADKKPSERIVSPEHIDPDVRVFFRNEEDFTLPDSIIKSAGGHMVGVLEGEKEPIADVWLTFNQNLVSRRVVVTDPEDDHDMKTVEAIEQMKAAIFMGREFTPDVIQRTTQLLNMVVTKSPDAAIVLASHGINTQIIDAIRESTDVKVIHAVNLDNYMHAIVRLQALITDL
ncbi:hypothetical protein ACFL3C_01030 [Patescibacteria group bacterium]